MQQAIERVTKSIDEYCNGDLPRSLAKIELVSSFKVICTKAGQNPDVLQDSVDGFIERSLERLDAGTVTKPQIISELAIVYEAAFNSDPKIEEYLMGSAS